MFFKYLISLKEIILLINLKDQNETVNWLIISGCSVLFYYLDLILPAHRFPGRLVVKHNKWWTFSTLWQQLLTFLHQVIIILKRHNFQRDIRMYLTVLPIDVSLIKAITGINSCFSIKHHILKDGFQCVWLPQLWKISTHLKMLDVYVWCWLIPHNAIHKRIMGAATHDNKLWIRVSQFQENPVCTMFKKYYIFSKWL